MATITIGQPADRARLLHTLVLGFSADPVARWASPDASTYMDRRHEFFGAFGGAAFEHGPAFVADDGAAVATWLPPGVEPDGEVMAAIMDEQTRRTARPRWTRSSNRWTAVTRRSRSGICR